MSAVLILFALLAAGAGLLMTTQATLGVAIICVGCLLAILARMAQALGHQHALLAVIETGKTPATSTVEPDTRIRCPKCAEMVTRGPATCPHCGSALS